LNEKLFGEPKRGIVAAIANVALDLKGTARITDRQVHEMLRKFDGRIYGRDNAVDALRYSRRGF
jgi:hypothetical protein